MGLPFGLPTPKWWSRLKLWFPEDDDLPPPSFRTHPDTYFFASDSHRGLDKYYFDNLIEEYGTYYLTQFMSFLPVGKLAFCTINDSKYYFIEFLKLSEDINESCILLTLFGDDSVNCVTAMLDGKTKGLLELPDYIADDMCDYGTPLQLAANMGSYHLTKLFIERRPLDAVNTRNAKNQLPLDEAHESRNPWTDPTCPLHRQIAKLCCPNERRYLETVRILAHHTKEVQEEFFKYAMEGSVEEVAQLLLAAPEKLLPLSSDLRKQILEKTSSLLVHDVRSAWAYGNDELRDKRMFMEVMILLLEVFEKCSDKFSAYLRLDRRMR